MKIKQITKLVEGKVQRYTDLRGIKICSVSEYC
jgi:hypothetical protein